MLPHASHFTRNARACTYIFTVMQAHEILTLAHMFANARGACTCRYDAKHTLLQEMQGKFHADLSNGIVLGNGISEYDQDPTDPHNRDTLKFMDAIQNEHFAVFEQLWVTQIH